MGIRICTLASGSSGNCIYVEAGDTRILIDAGLAARETARRLSLIGVDIAGVSAICVTHEHSDHIAGLDVLHRRAGLKLYANAGTIEGIGTEDGVRPPAWNVFSTGSAFRIGNLELEPFSVPHDAYDPVGFVVRTPETKVAIVTDMGTVTTLIRERLKACHAIILESNHDEQLLKDAARPWSLKQRILGRHGHLSNADAASLIEEVASPTLRQIFLAHLSAECNRPDLAVKSMKDALARIGHTRVGVALTYPDRNSEVWEGD